MTAYSLIAIAAAYALGSLSFAVIVSRALGLSDPRSYGSGNPGATNVLRSGSKKAAALTLLLDAFKGWLPVALILHAWPAAWGDATSTAAWAGVAAFVGHVFPVFFRFQGGKGVATAAGVLLAYYWAVGLLALLVWLLVAVTFRYSSLAALVAALAAPLIYMLGINGWWPLHAQVLLAIVVMCSLLLWRHKDNLGRLLRGQESRIGQKKAPDGDNTSTKQ